MSSKIEVGEYKLKNTINQVILHLCITKRTKKYIHLHIKVHHMFFNSLYDIKVRKKIFIDENNSGYIKDIYYN